MMVTEYKKGDRVQHDVYGAGEIIDVLGNQSKKGYQISFDGGEVEIVFPGPALHLASDVPVTGNDTLPPQPTKRKELIKGEQPTQMPSEATATEEPTLSLCQICEMPVEGSDGSLDQCWTCIEASAILGIGILHTKNPANVSRMWSMVMRYLKQPRDEFSAFLDNCETCDEPMLVGAREREITPRAAKYCRRECKP